MAKTVHKKGFHNSFEVVETPVVQCVCLNWVNDTLSLVAKKLVNREVVEYRIENQRTQVFPEEKSAILNLGSQILENHG